MVTAIATTGNVIWSLTVSLVSTVAAVGALVGASFTLLAPICSLHRVSCSWWVNPAPVDVWLMPHWYNYSIQVQPRNGQKDTCINDHLWMMTNVSIPHLLLWECLYLLLTGIDLVFCWIPHRCFECGYGRSIPLVADEKVRGKNVTCVFHVIIRWLTCTFHSMLCFIMSACGLASNQTQETMHLLRRRERWNVT